MHARSRMLCAAPGTRGRLPVGSPRRDSRATESVARICARVQVYSVYTSVTPWYGLPKPGSPPSRCAAYPCSSGIPAASTRARVSPAGAAATAAVPPPPSRGVSSLSMLLYTHSPHSSCNTVCISVARAYRVACWLRGWPPQRLPTRLSSLSWCVLQVSAQPQCARSPKI